MPHDGDRQFVAPLRQTFRQSAREREVLHRPTGKPRIRDDSVARVAFAVGFRDVRTFERAFKRCVGLTPSAYRASVRPKSR